MAKNGLKPLKKLGDPKVKNSNPKPVRVIREDKAPYKRETYPETWRAMDRHFGLRPKPRGGDRAKLHKRADSAWYLSLIPI